MLRSLLEGPFDVIDCVTDGEALVRAAARLSPDVIVSDIGMPRMDGIDAVRRILATNRDARVVFVTVQSNVSVVERSLAEGVLGYVVKLVAGDGSWRRSTQLSGVSGISEGSLASDRTMPTAIGDRRGGRGGSARRDGGQITCRVCLGQLDRPLILSAGSHRADRWWPAIG